MEKKNNINININKLNKQINSGQLQKIYSNNSKYINDYKNKTMMKGYSTDKNKPTNNSASNHLNDNQKCINTRIILKNESKQTDNQNNNIQIFDNYYCLNCRKNITKEEKLLHKNCFFPVHIRKPEVLAVR